MTFLFLCTSAQRQQQHYRSITQLLSTDLGYLLFNYNKLMNMTDST